MTNAQFILLHRNDDVHALALKTVPDGVDIHRCLQQIEGWQLARRKLPRWAATEGLEYPPRLSLEQCSSESTAQYKQRLVKRLLPTDRSIMADLTAGMGIDFSYLAPLFDRAIYVERQEHLCTMAKHNMPLLGVMNANIVCTEAETFQNEMDECSLIYLDPARRDCAGRKVAAMKDCSPDVTKLAGNLLEHAPLVIVKLSPMLDIHEAVRLLPGVCEVHVVSVSGECKELLLVMRRNTTEPLRYYCADIGDADTLFTAVGGALGSKVAAKVGKYLYEPNASVLKAGVQDALCEAFGVEKLHPFSHLFTSTNLVEGFPGRAFLVQSVCDFSKKSIKALLSSIPKANITVRNFPSTVAELRRKWKINEGGNDYLFVTTVADASHVIIRCIKA